MNPRVKVDSSRLPAFTCYGVDPDAFDPESFGWRQLSVEGVLHNLVVPHVPTLGFTHISARLMASNSEDFSLRSPETASPLPETWSCGSCPSSSRQSTPDCPEGRVELTADYCLKPRGSLAPGTCALSNWSLSISHVQIMVPVRPDEDTARYSTLQIITE